jgi:hypothetical protein
MEAANIKYVSLATSKNGVTVVYNPVHSHAATHLEDTPQLESLIIELISTLELKGQKIATYFDMGRVVGTCDVVTIDVDDVVVYGIRKNREDDGLVPFTKSRPGEPCPYVAVQLEPIDGNAYELTSAWIGTFSDDDEPFPLSKHATKNSVQFWNQRAFVYGSQEIIEGTETTEKPW